MVQQQLNKKQNLTYLSKQQILLRKLLLSKPYAKLQALVLKKQKTSLKVLQNHSKRVFLKKKQIRLNQLLKQLVEQLRLHNFSLKIKSFAAGANLRQSFSNSVCFTQN